MAEIVQAQCGHCRKRFSLRSDQVNRDVRCPHCKTVVRITSGAGGGQDPAAAFREVVAQHQQQHRQQPQAHAPAPHGPPMPAVGLRTRSLAIVWVALLGCALIGVIVGLYVVFKRDTDRILTPGMFGPRTGQHFERDGGVGPSEPGTGPEAAAANTGSAPAGSKVPTPEAPEPIDVKVERILRGYSEETITYAVGRVTNNMEDPIRVLKVIVELMDKDDKPMGEATAVILNIPPKYTVPLVAEWKHEEGQRASRWMLSSWETNPTGIPQDLPPLVAEDPWPRRDPNSVTPTGTVTTKVTNHGAIPVQDLLCTGILLDTAGKIVGAMKVTLTKEIKPGAAGEIAFDWDHCAGSLVNSVQVWVQPAL